MRIFRSTRRVRSRPLSSEQGFSLTELMAVLGMLGVLVAIAIPKIDFTRYRVNSEIRNVVGHMSYAQRLAVSLQHNVEVTIDVANNQIRSHEDRNNDGIYDPSERVGTITLENGVTFSRGAAPDLPAPAPTNTLVKVTFRRDGSADMAGVIFINSVRGVSTSTLTDARGIEVIRATGRAVWYSYAGGSWKRGG